ncbi:DUF3443 family protein [Paraburkholderia xenovorans]|uniref:DUF3443 family protein n=1 Tax=Paraburkholderia xenovorans TaxID=36873 RepID=UPI0038B73889
MRKIAWIFAVTLGLTLAGCGGGGGSSNSATASSQSGGGNQVAPPVNQNVSNVLAADASAVPTSSLATNTVPVTVSATGILNQPMTSVQICTPGSNGVNNCSTIPNVIVDTGSYGLRLFRSVIPNATFNTLVAEKDTNNQTLAECAVFGSGFGWGTVYQADVKLSSEVAQNLPIHVLADPALSTAAPTACQNGTALTTPAAMGANGILGIGASPTDCPSCTLISNPSFYYTNAGTVTTVTASQLVANPVSKFVTDNNGVILEMAQVSDSGSPTGSGTLVFGIDTQSNNALAGTNATLIRTDSSGTFTSTFNGATQRNTFFDSGSTELFFADSTIPHASSGFYVPTSPVGRTATLTTISPSTATFGFNIANATVVTAGGNTAFNNLGVFSGGQLDLGIPAFYGRHVYYGITGTTSTGGGTGPYVAYTSS